jgi:hypothetical protein
MRNPAKIGFLLRSYALGLAAYPRAGTVMLRAVIDACEREAAIAQRTRLYRKA